LSGFGALIEETTTAQGQAWVVGRTQFETVLGPADGLGPIFNGQSCVQCHTQPDISGAPIPGGASAVTETRFMTTNNVFDLLHQAALDPTVQDGVPIDAVLVAHRTCWSNQTESPTNKDDIDRFTDFMQLNAPPPTVPLTNQAKLGQTVFKMINCIACHTPSMTTGANSIAALSFQPVPLYSDLLLHDMGTLGDGIVQAAAGATFMRAHRCGDFEHVHRFCMTAAPQLFKKRFGFMTVKPRLFAIATCFFREAPKDALIAFLNSI
jgi:mono/diheme cytochrome c family protein